MANVDPREWLLLIHQIPPKPNALRVKIWRRLQQVGAVAIKPSVYVMPPSEQSREDFSWILKEIGEGGGGGSISVARFVEGLSDEQIIALFRNARRLDYEKLILETNALLADWSSGAIDPRDPALKGPAQLSRLQRRLADIGDIDFFNAPQRVTGELLLQKLANFLTGQSSSGNTLTEGLGDLMGKTWVTRENLFVDRIACGWLIRRFVEKTALFKFVPGPRYTPRAGEIRFDMFDGEFTHEGGRCSFEVMIRRFGLRDPALGLIAEVVHDIDLKEAKFGRNETDGFNALLTGLVSAHPDDDQRMTEGLRLFDNLYAYYRRKKGGRHAHH